MEDLEEDESDIEDTAELGASYWGAWDPLMSDRGENNEGGRDYEDGADEDEGENTLLFWESYGNQL